MRATRSVPQGDSSIPGPTHLPGFVGRREEECIVEPTKHFPRGKFEAKIPSGCATAAQEREHPLEMDPADVSLETGRAHRVANEPSRQRLGKRRPAIDRHSNPVRANFDPLLRRLTDQDLDPFAVPPLCFGQIAEVPEELRIESVRQTRQPVVTQTVACESAIGIRRILPPREPTHPGRLGDRVGRCPEERPKPTPGRIDGRHRGEPVRAGPSKQPKEDGLGLIAQVMRRRDVPRTVGVGHLLEGGPANAPRGLFQGGPRPARKLASPGLGIDLAEVEPKAGSLRQLADEAKVAGRILAAQTVVDVADDQLEIARLGGARQRVEQHDRIAAAGNGHEEPRTGDPGRFERFAEDVVDHPRSVPPTERAGALSCWDRCPI